MEPPGAELVKTCMKSGTYYPLGILGTVPRAYERMERRTNKNKEIESRNT
jgi:hypothetical protein